SVATLTISIAAVVTTNPVSTNVCAGAVVSFRAAASGAPAPTLQWQANSGGGFTNIPGATSSPLSFAASVSQSNNQYRAVFSNTCGSVTRSEARLTINNPVVITNPVSTSACTGTVVSFTAIASGTPAPTLQWQANSGGGFTNIQGATSSPLSFTAGLSQSNNQYRAVFSNTCGSVT